MVILTVCILSGVSYFSVSSVNKIFPKIKSLILTHYYFHKFSFNDDEYISENQKKLDVLHYDLSFDLFPGQKYFKASAQITGIILDHSITSLDLNFHDNFEIKAVYLNDLATIYQNSGTSFSIPLENNITDTFRIKIIYNGTPKRVGLEGFVFGERNGYSLVYTLSEPNYASSWFPCNDIPNDKSLIDMRITNDSSKVSVSNGRLINILTNDDRKTYHWKTYYPVSTYLVALYSADYEEFSEEYTSLDGNLTMPVNYYVLPDKLEKSKVDFSEHTDILKVFAKLFGEYPFIKEKYGVAEFLWTMGAMENQTITGVSSGLIGGKKFFNDYLIHELAHHWWGNAVGPDTWKDIWLNEGFSTYSEALYFEVKHGKEALQSTMKKKYFRRFSGTLSDPEPNIFSSTVYNKGAWVLHMLRWEVGDASFFKILKIFFETYKYSNASTNDFIEVAQNISGKNLDDFFHQWLDYEGEIKVKFNWSVVQNAAGYKTEIFIEQDQENPEHYNFPLEIMFQLVNGNQIRKIYYINSKETNINIETEDIIESVLLDPDGWLLGTFREEFSSK
ncbi:MAG TPA: M1 family metallopeptidase [Ignavibacteriaceae bacterium]|nr:M1 family metallopeptidase [Ignavibacteriaceae bacterium]